MTSKQKTPVETPPLDATAMVQLYADIAAKSSALLTQYMARASEGLPALNDEMGISKAFFAAWQQMLADPQRIADMQMKLWQDYTALWQQSMLKMLGQDAASVAQPEKSDRRFRHEDWENNLLFDYVKQS